MRTLPIYMDQWEFYVQKVLPSENNFQHKIEVQNPPNVDLNALDFKELELQFINQYSND